MQQAAHPASMLTADQRRLLTTLQGLVKEKNWQGVVSLEGEALEFATTVGGVHPALAAALYSQKLGLSQALMVLFNGEGYTFPPLTVPFSFPTAHECYTRILPAHQRVLETSRVLRQMPTILDEEYPGSGMVAFSSPAPPHSWGRS